MIFFLKHKIFPFFLLMLTLIFYIYFCRKIEINPLIDKSSIHYINDLYMSNELYYDNLNYQEQKLYMNLLEAINNYKANYYININKDNCYSLEKCSSMGTKAMEAIIMDHPELLQIANYSWSYNSLNDSENVKLTFSYAIKFKFISKLGEMRIARIIDKIKKTTKNMSEIEKIKYVYEWIGENNKYNKTFMYFDSNQSAFTVFINHNSVCAGFAKASQIIFQNIGITSYYVTGTSTGPHAFNIVKVEDKYYLYDSTVASTINSESDNFYKGLEQKYLSSFSIDNQNLYPELNTDEIFMNK